MIRRDEEVKMVQVVKYIKCFAKLSLFIVIVYAIGSFIDGNIIFKSRIRRFSIRKVSYDAFNLKKRFRTSKIKYILIWSNVESEFDCLKDIDVAFQENKCSHDNCYVTKDKNLLGGDYRNFDAVIINGKYLSVSQNETFDLPKKRFFKQSYVFATKESADNYPICNKKFDNYFNLTWTYRLDSDATWPYFAIFDMKGREVGPQLDMNWISEYDRFENKDILTMKKVAATWFVSNCYTKSRREIFFNDIKAELKNLYNLHVDVIGSCGTSECPSDKDQECMQQIEKYYFYFAFENSLSDYYVTEKVLKALQHDTIPVVYGADDYSSFLPPDSYIDARHLGVEGTAATMAYLIKNHTAYLEYFRWRNHYRYGPATSSVCNLCRMLNKRGLNMYAQLRQWWNPNYKTTCETRLNKIKADQRNYTLAKRLFSKKVFLHYVAK